MTDAEYTAWLGDSRRNQHRVLLIVATHSGGSIFLGSQPYRAKTAPFDEYNDFLMNAPVLDQVITGAAGVGDFTIHEGNITGLLSNQWRGHNLLIYYGDVDWPLPDFKLAASALIESVDYAGGSLYQFNIVDKRELYSATVPATVSKTDSVTDLLNWIETTGGFDSVSHGNLSATQQSIELSINVTADRTQWSDVLDIIADSVGGYWRITNLGGAELLVKPSTPAHALTDDDIIENSINQIDSIPAVADVVVRYDWAGGYDVTANDPDNTHSVDSSTTVADTGTLSESADITTALTRLIDAQDLTNQHLLARSQVQRTFELMVTGKSMLINVGDLITINSGILSGDYLVTRVKLSPVELSSLIEVRQ